MCCNSPVFPDRTGAGLWSGAMRDVSTRKSGSDCRLTVVTPMYNEGECIRNNISRIVSVLEGMGVSWEYILVDDGSTDDSYARAREAMAGCPNCRLVGYARNRGRGYALRQGIDAARGDYVVTTESDLSWGEEIIPQLYEALASGTDDMVIASINQDGGGFENVPPFRKLLSRLGNRVFRLCYGGDITMFSGMTRGTAGRLSSPCTWKRTANRFISRWCPRPRPCGSGYQRSRPGFGGTIPPGDAVGLPSSRWCGTS